MKIQSKDDIIKHLIIRQQELSDIVLSINNDLFNQDKGDKWSIAENIDHLIRSTNPISLSMAYIPKPLFSLLMGISKTDPEGYDDIVTRYQSKLSNGAKAALPYTPKPFFPKDKKKAIDKWNKCIDKLVSQIERWNERDLEQYRMPHPIIGKISILEMLFFVLYHIEHHTKTIKNLAAK